MHRYPRLLPLLLIIITIKFNLFFTQLQAAEEFCAPFSCNHHKHIHDPIQFPFWVPDNQTSRCGYPGFELSCNSNNNNNRPYFSISSNNLTVESISYSDQSLLVSDPNHCIPKLLLEIMSDYFKLYSTPFNFGPLDPVSSSESETMEVSYMFLNCSGRKKPDPNKMPDNAKIIPCVSGENQTVVVASNEEAALAVVGKWRCEVLGSLEPLIFWRDLNQRYNPIELSDDMSDALVQLSWLDPRCGGCAAIGGSCGFLPNDSIDVGCYYYHTSGLPKSAKYGLILGAGIPGLLCIIGLTLYASSKVRARDQNRRNANTESSPSIFPQPIILTLGLDGSTIESYPKTILGESKRLPKPSDSMCPICLSDYQPKETLRFIPNCNHYFHADCIDEWLKMNATCPLCRNSPQPPSAFGGC